MNPTLPLLFVVYDKDIIGREFLGTMKLDLPTLFQLWQQRVDFTPLAVKQLLSGISWHKKEFPWEPIVSGALEVTFTGFK